MFCFSVFEVVSPGLPHGRSFNTLCCHEGDEAEGNAERWHWQVKSEHVQENDTVFLERASERSLEAAWQTAVFPGCPGITFSFVLHGTTSFFNTRSQPQTQALAGELLSCIRREPGCFVGRSWVSWIRQDNGFLIVGRQLSCLVLTYWALGQVLLCRCGLCVKECSMWSRP